MFLAGEGGDVIRFSMCRAKIQLERPAWEEKRTKRVGQVSAFCGHCTKGTRERAFGIARRKLDKVKPDEYLLLKVFIGFGS